MCAMVVHSRPPGRGPAGPAEVRPRRAGTRGGGRVGTVVRTAEPGSGAGYRRLQEPHHPGRQDPRHKATTDPRMALSDLHEEEVSAADHIDRRARSGSSRQPSPQPPVSELQGPGGETSTPGDYTDPGPRPAGPYRRPPARTRPTTVATPIAEGRNSSLVSYNKRTVNRTRRRARPASVVEASVDHGRKGATNGDSEDHGVAPRANSSLDFFSADFGPDTGWDTDLEQDGCSDEEESEVKESYDATGRAIYLESCRKSGVIPASYFLRHMTDTKLDMKHHGLGPAGVKPLAVALVSNTSVIQLSLKDNWLGTEGGTHVCEMLKENCYITHVDLSDNKLGDEFSFKFMDVLNSNNTLTHVTLSGNCLDDRAAGYISEAIMNTMKLEFVDLSHNHLGELAGESLGMAISENSSIKHLDLSWNCMRRKGAVCIANGIKNNVLMQRINLSWNGFGNEGAAAIGDALKANSSLEELDVSNNRINTEGSVLLSKGLVVNETLKCLKMGKNPMQSAGCYAVCAALLKNNNSVLETLDFTDILINNDFLDVFKKLKEQLPDVKLRHGGDGLVKKPKVRVHPMLKLKNYIQKHNLRLVDFFNRFDSDGSMSVTREEFAQGIEESGLQLTEGEVVELLDELDKDGDGEINYSALSLIVADKLSKANLSQGPIVSVMSPRHVYNQISPMEQRIPERVSDWASRLHGP